MLSIFSSVLIYAALSSTVVEYRFGHNFGQIFHDYSNNERDGVNGESSTTNTKDVISTDRGVFFDNNSETYVKTPPNDIVATDFTLGSTFVVLIWILPYDDYGFYIFYRKTSDDSEYFAIERSSDHDALSFSMENSGGSFSKKSSTDSFPKGKKKIETWVLACVKVIDTTVTPS